jgi:hypothetical protein
MEKTQRYSWLFSLYSNRNKSVYISVNNNTNLKSFRYFLSTQYGMDSAKNHFTLLSLKDGIWSDVYDMAGGPAGHPYEDDISESKDDSRGSIGLLPCLVVSSFHYSRIRFGGFCVSYMEKSSQTAKTSLHCLFLARAGPKIKPARRYVILKYLPTFWRGQSNAFWRKIRFFW